MDRPPEKIAKERDFPVKQLTFHILILLVLAGAAGSQVACGTNSNADEPPEPQTETEASAEAEAEAIPVEVASLEAGEIEAVLRFSTNLEAEDAVQVFAEASQVVEELLVEEGSRVSKGQLLLRLRDDELATALAKVEAQHAKAKREYERQQRLYDQELVSEQALNDSTYELERLELERQEARLALEHTDVRAPITGTVTARSVGVGDYVTVNQHLFDLVDMGSIVARIFVPEKQLPQLSPGQLVRVSSPALGTESYRGRVDRIAPVVDPASGTVKVTVALPQQESLRPGMYVDVELVTETEPQALLVPKRALVYDDDQAFVYRIEDDGDVPKARRIAITPRLEDKVHVVPTDGLEVGDRLVLAGQAGLKDGATVRILETAPQGAEPAERVGK